MTYAVLFDLDETLFDRTRSLGRFLRHQFAEVYPGVVEHAARAVARFVELDCRGMTPKTFVYDQLLAEAGRSDPKLSSEMFAHYESNAWRFARSADGMDDMLEQLRQGGVQLGIVTNGQTHIQLRTILALDLDRKVDCYLISEQEQLRKPDPALSLRAAERLGVHPERCMFVGDTPETDLLGAWRSGMETVWLPNGAQWSVDLPFKADHIVHSLREIPDLVARPKA